jgi:hypothetical protein
MADKRRVHVTPKGDNWAVQREGAKKASGVHDTKKEAVDQGRNLAKQDKGQLLIHGKDGKIQEERTYRKDPFPPEG